MLRMINAVGLIIRLDKDLNCSKPIELLIGIRLQNITFLSNRIFNRSRAFSHSLIFCRVFTACMLDNPNENASCENSLFSAHHQAPIEMTWTLDKMH